MKLNEIDFMESKKGLFQLPRKKKDTIWLSKSGVLCKVDIPVATGKSEKMYKLDNQTLEKVQKLYKGD